MWNFGVSNVLRLNSFQGNTDMIEYLKEQGIVGLLCADYDIISYDLNKDQHDMLKENEFIVIDRMLYYNTDFRFDDKKFITSEMLKLRAQEILVLVIHE